MVVVVLVALLIDDVNDAIKLALFALISFCSFSSFLDESFFFCEEEKFLNLQISSRLILRTKHTHNEIISRSIKSAL